MIEGAFGILACRWRIFRKPIIASLRTVENIIKATVCLHNFILKKELKKPVNERRYIYNVTKHNECGDFRDIVDMDINVSQQRNAVSWQNKAVLNNNL